jgi:hypothetical protein
VNIEFLATVAVIAPDPTSSRSLYIHALGLALHGGGDGYYSEQLTGASRSHGRCRKPPRRASGPTSGRQDGWYRR